VFLADVVVQVLVSTVACRAAAVASHCLIALTLYHERILQAIGSIA